MTAPNRYCRKCRYIIDHLDRNCCPECGAAFDPADPATYRLRARSGRARKLLIAAVALAFLWCFLDVILPNAREWLAIRLTNIHARRMAVAAQSIRTGQTRAHVEALFGNSKGEEYLYFDSHGSICSQLAWKYPAIGESLGRMDVNVTFDKEGRVEKYLAAEVRPLSAVEEVMQAVGWGQP